jgi:integrase
MQGLHRHRHSARWCFCYRDPGDGQWKHRSTGTVARREAVAVRLAFLEELRRGQVPTDTAKWTVAEAADHWLKFRTDTKRPRSTVLKDKRVLYIVKRGFGTRRLEDITNWMLEAYQAKRAQKVSAYSVNREIRYLAILLKRAKLWRRLQEDYRPLKEEASTAWKVFEPEHVTHLLAIADENDRWKYVGWCFLLAISTGMRGGEIKKLRLGDVELGDRPAVRISLVHGDGRRGTKTTAGERRVPLNAQAAWAAARLLERAKQYGADDASHYLLPGNLSRHNHSDDPFKDARGLSPQVPQASFRHVWEDIVSEATKKYPELAGGRFHDARHTFITARGRAEVPLEKIQALVGHMSGRICRYYLHLSDRDTRSIVDAISTNYDLPNVEILAPKTKAA